jgi:hypothetical protein
MSFALTKKSDELARQVEYAGGKGIVMVCGTHDEGEKVVNSWPADWKEVHGVMVITA